VSARTLDLWSDPADDPPVGVRTDDRRARFFELSSDLLCILDLDGSFVDVNDAWRVELGLIRAVLVGQPLRRFVHPDDHDELDAHLGNLRFGARHASIEVRLLGADRREHWIALRLAGDREAGCIHGAGRDITDRKVLYDVARRVLTTGSPAQLCDVVLRNVDALMPGDHTVVALFDDSGGVHLYELDAGGDLEMREVDGEEFGDFDELREGRVRLVADLAGSEAASPLLEAQAEAGLASYLRVPLVSAGGTLGALHFGSDLPAAYGQRDVVLGMELARQVAMALLQIGLKQRLAESEAAFRGIAANADGLVVLDEQGVVRFTNRAAEELFGVQWGGLDGRRLDLPRVDGERSTIQPHLLVPTASPETVAEVRVAETRWGGGAAWLASLRDITEQRVLEAQLNQAQKMGVVGRLAGGVSHDFNNLLTAMLGNVDLLREELGADHNGSDSLEAIAVAVDRAAGVARQLLAFSRKQVVDPKVVDLNERVERFERVLRSLCGEDVTLEFALLDGPLPVLLDPIQLEQVLMNLVVNARDAITERGTVRVSTRVRELLPTDVGPDVAFVPGVYVELAVQDDGAGMQPEVLKRIFEPFFTTKPVGQGLGLGMPTVHDIVERSGGHLRVRSEVDRGTRVEVLLPAHEEIESLLAATSTFSLESMTVGEGIVLVVDDEAPVRTVVAQGLRAAGYEVQVAGGPLEALRLIDDGFLPDLLLTDVRMPEMSGVELDLEVRKRCDVVKTLFMSGYSEEILAPSGVLEEGIEFLGKPFRLPHLLKRVRSMMRDP
jgi:PAS domain S-box-containing protein